MNQSYIQVSIFSTQSCENGFFFAFKNDDKDIRKKKFSLIADKLQKITLVKALSEF
jgi:hypothetical protein